MGVRPNRDVVEIVNLRTRQSKEENCEVRKANNNHFK